MPLTATSSRRQIIVGVLFGQSAGPRFGSFAALFGPAQTAAMIRKALAGEFLS